MNKDFFASSEESLWNFSAQLLLASRAHVTVSTHPLTPTYEYNTLPARLLTASLLFGASRDITVKAHSGRRYT